MLKSELSEVRKQIKLEKDSVHVLKAEMAYLASPERLSKLNNNYLQLQGPHTYQLVQNPLAKDKGRTYAMAKNVDIDRSAKRIIVSEEKAANSSDVIKTSYNANIANQYSKAEQRPVKWRYKKGPAKYTNGH